MKSETATVPDLDTLSRMFRDNRVERIFIKRLAPNDNSKNQIYLGGDFSVLNVLPSGELHTAKSGSVKPGRRNRQILKSPLRFFWVDGAGRQYLAPRAQLILYPQYPEVRLSGIVQGSGTSLGRWLDVARDGRKAGRILILGVSTTGDVFACLALPGSATAKALESSASIGSFGALDEISFGLADPRRSLIDQLRRIHALGWIPAKKLDRMGRMEACCGQNCGGYTLEAELGVIPNGLVQPDYHGWEVKTFSVRDFDSTAPSVITVMTPEPDGGFYHEKGPRAFVKKFGYTDRKGRANRMNFGGVHKYRVQHALTGLILDLSGYDTNTRKILDAEGGIALLAGDRCAASWSFRKLIEHWKKKHAQAAYVPNLATKDVPRSYYYAPRAGLGEGADFGRLVGAFVRGDLYYDPGLKLETPTGASAKVKCRNQFRIKYRNVWELYERFGEAGYKPT